MRKIKSQAILTSMLATALLPAIFLPVLASDFRQLNMDGIKALRSGDYARAELLFAEALKNYLPEDTDYDDGIKSNLKLAQDLLSGKADEGEVAKSSPKIHSGYVSRNQDVSAAGKDLVLPKAGKVLRPIPASSDLLSSKNWSLYEEQDALSGISQRRGFTDQTMMRGSVVDLAARFQQMVQSANAQRDILRGRMAEIEARIAADERHSSMQARVNFIPSYVPPPPSYQNLQRSYAPYVPLVPQAGV